MRDLPEPPVANSVLRIKEFLATMPLPEFGRAAPRTVLHRPVRCLNPERLSCSVMRCRPKGLMPKVACARADSEPAFAHVPAGTPTALFALLAVGLRRNPSGSHRARRARMASIRGTRTRLKHPLH